MGAVFSLRRANLCVCVCVCVCVYVCVVCMCVYVCGFRLIFFAVMENSFSSRSDVW